MVNMKGYKTLIWTAANAVVPVMEAVDAAYQIPAAWVPYWIAVYMAGNVVLRAMTNTPMGSHH